jgi:two-component system, response regulator, stage 0 sporulation protein F
MILDERMPQRYGPRRERQVLLAEDDAEMRHLMAWALRHDGYDVLEATDGDEAMTLLGTIETKDARLGLPDLIVSDVRMPGYSGLEMLERLRRENAKVPVILVTAFGDWATHAQAERLGAQVLDKPFDLDDLRALVFDALELT